MPDPKILLAGDAEAVGRLESALAEHGFEARTHPSEGLPGSLVALERELEGEPPDAAVAVGAGEDALALAITASKLGVPLAACLDASDPPADRRILSTLAELEAGSDPARAADLIASWLRDGAVRL